MMPTHRIRSEESSGCTQRQRAKNKDMAFLAHRSGPRESELLDRLGHGLFGCAPAKLEEDISSHRYAESRGEVVPVHIDAEDKPYIEFSFRQPPSSRPFYLLDHGFALPLDIATFTEEESRRWSKACELRNRDGGL
jgi:hypothetical protein